MSASARFLLEFQATGDQEVVNKIREVGAAGKEAATDLESLQTIEDPFAAVGQGAEGAIAPITEVGSAAEELGGVFGTTGGEAETFGGSLDQVGSATEGLGGIFTGAGTEAEDFGGALGTMNESALAVEGGLTGANTVMGDFGESATTAGASTQSLGGSVTNIAGSITALGGTIGSAVGAFFRYQDIQLKVQKAQLAAARSAEAYRKAEAAVDALLSKATSNAAGIAAARERLSQAQAKVNQLMDQGVTSGAEWEAAQGELQAAQAALSAEYKKGGGDVAKLTAAMEKAELAAGKNATSINALEKANRTANQGILDLAFGFAGLAGSLVQTITGMKNTITVIKGLGTAIKALPLAAMGVAFAAGAAAVGALLASTRALSFNLGGVTDAMSGVGKAFGDALPPIQGFLTALEDAGRSTVDFFTRYTEGLVSMAGVTGAKIDFSKAKFSDLVAQYIKTGSTGSATFDGIISDLISWAKTNGVSMDEVMQKAKAMDGQYTASGQKVTAATTQMVSSTTKLTAAWKDVEQGVSEVESELFKQHNVLVATANNNLELAHTNDLLTGSQQDLEVATTGITLKLSESNRELATAKQVRGDAAAQSELLHTAINNEVTALINEEAALKGSIAALRDHEVQTLAVSNAYLQGIKSIDEWNSGLATSASEQQGAIDRLAELGFTFDKLPPFVERSVENLKLFGEAATTGGEAAKEAAGVAAEAWRNATSIIGGELQGLADIFMEGGEKMKESTDEWFAGIEQSIGRNLTGAETAALTGIGNMIASTEQAIADWQLGQIMGESIASSGAQLASAFEGLATTASAGMKAVFQKAAEIARSGQPDLIAAMNEVMANVGTTAPGALLKQLDAILAPGLKASATKAGEAIPGALDPAAATAGQSAALTLSQEFAAAGVHIAAVMKGIEKNMVITTNPLAPMISLAMTSVDQMVSAVNQKISAIKPSVTTNPLAPMISAAMASLDQFASAVGQKMAQVRAAFSKGLGGVKGAAKGINVGIYYRYYIVGKPPQPKPFNLGIYYRYYIVNAKPNPPNIQKGIYYRYYVVGSRPNPPNLNRTITYRYRTVGTRPAQTGMHENLSQDTLIAAHRGERVDITPGTISSNENRTAIIPATGQNARPINIVVRGDVNGKELIRFVKFNLMEGTGGVM
jgi:hypothetical protein